MRMVFCFLPTLFLLLSQKRRAEKIMKSEAIPQPLLIFFLNLAICLMRLLMKKFMSFGIFTSIIAYTYWRNVSAPISLSVGGIWRTLSMNPFSFVRPPLSHYRSVRNAPLSKGMICCLLLSKSIMTFHRFIMKTMSILCALLSPHKIFMMKQPSKITVWNACIWKRRQKTKPTLLFFAESPTPPNPSSRLKWMVAAKE